MCINNSSEHSLIHHPLLAGDSSGALAKGKRNREMERVPSLLLRIRVFRTFPAVAQVRVAELSCRAGPGLIAL